MKNDVIAETTEGGGGGCGSVLRDAETEGAAEGRGDATCEARRGAAGVGGASSGGGSANQSAAGVTMSIMSHLRAYPIRCSESRCLGVSRHIPVALRIRDGES